MAASRLSVSGQLRGRLWAVSRGRRHAGSQNKHGKPPTKTAARRGAGEVIIKIDPTDFNLQCFWTAPVSFWLHLDSRDPPGRQFARLNLTRFIHYLQGALFSFWLHLDNYKCRDAVKIVRHPGVQIEQTGPRDDRVQSWPHQACWSYSQRGRVPAPPDADPMR